MQIIREERVFYMLVIYNYILCETHSWKNVWRCFIGFSIILNLKGVKKFTIGIAAIGNNYNGYVLLWVRSQDSGYHLLLLCEFC